MSTDAEDRPGRASAARRVAGWTLFLASLVSLIALGLLIERIAEPAPRWTVRLPWEECDVSSAGNHFITVFIGGDRWLVAEPPRELQGNGSKPPPVIIDTETGRERRTGIAEGRWPAERWFSPSGRWVVGWDWDRGPSARIIDIDTGHERQIRAGPGPYYPPILVSPDERLLFMQEHPRQPDPDQGTLVFDFETGERITKLPISGYFGRFDVPGLFLFETGRQTSPKVVLWDMKRRAEIASLPYGDLWSLRPGKRLLTHVSGALILWDIADPSRPQQLMSISVDHPHSLLVTDDGRLAVTFPNWGPEGPPPHLIQVWDVRERRKVWEHGVHGPLGQNWPVLSPDGRLCAVWEHEPGSHNLGSVSVLDLHKKRLLWRFRPASEYPTFSPDSQALLIRDARTALNVFDARTGEERAEITRTGDAWASYFDEDNRLWVTDYVPKTHSRDERAVTIRCLEWPSLRELYRLPDHGRYSRHIQLNRFYTPGEGHRFLITYHREEGQGLVLKCWDVPHRKPWVWIVGVPLAVGAALLGLRAWWWARGKREGEAPAEPSSPMKSA